MAMFGSIGGGVSRSSTSGSQRVKAPGWFRKGVLPGYISDYQGLRGEDPYGGPGLGLGRETLELLPGGARDLAAGARTGSEQRIDTIYGSPGGPGAGSFAHRAAKAGLANQYAASTAEAGREAALEDARLSREDYERRLATGGQLADVARAFSTVRTRERSKKSNISGSVGF